MKKEVSLESDNEHFLVDSAYDRILEAILHLKFKPGTYLTEAMLSRQLGFSRTPTREALKRLEEQNLVRIIPRRGALVTDISAENIVEIYQLREALECYAIQFVPEFGIREELNQILDKANNSKLWIENKEVNKIDELDIQLHYFIVRSSRNQLLVKIEDQLLGQVLRLRRMTPNFAGRLEHQREEHIQIITALKEGKISEAREYLRNHLHKVCETAIQIRIKMW